MLTKQQAIDGLIKAVAALDEDRKSDPQYVKNGRPECIVAHTFVALGIPVPGPTDKGAYDLWKDGHYEAEEQAAHVLQFAQYYADLGDSWLAVVHETIQRDKAGWFEIGCVLEPWGEEALFRGVYAGEPIMGDSQ